MKGQPVKAWKHQPSEVNSNNIIISPLNDGSDSLPLVKTNVPVKKDSNLGNINQPINEISNNDNSYGNDNNFGGIGNNNIGGMNNNLYGGMNNSLYGGGYGNSNFGGGYGMGMGGYGMGMGMGMGGYGGYGMGMGMGRGMSDPNNPDFLDKCFFTIEKMNFQIFHLCELARMIHQQSTALLFLYDIIKKGYSTVNTYAKDKIRSIFSSLKNYGIDKIIRLKQFTKEFLSKSENLEDNKIRSHIKILDKLLIFMLILASSTIIVKAIAVK